MFFSNFSFLTFCFMSWFILFHIQFKLIIIAMPRRTPHLTIPGDAANVIHADSVGPTPVPVVLTSVVFVPIPVVPSTYEVDDDDIGENDHAQSVAISSSSSWKLPICRNQFGTKKKRAFLKILFLKVNALDKTPEYSSMWWEGSQCETLP